jgi:hypothetical protein
MAKLTYYEGEHYENREQVEVEARFPIVIELQDGNVFTLGMVDETELGLFALDTGNPEGESECLWSKDYAIQNQEDENGS